ncbi:hypothetical protein NL676_011832 [Syzygium grande]|nr:hypothetical protein NL676_011832 [Syzygium grande]
MLCTKKKAMAKRSVKAAVIGAGISFEKDTAWWSLRRAAKSGGTWVYDPRVESDLLGLDLAREVVHGSMYKSLRVNLPRQIMGFSDYPLEVKHGIGDDPRQFPGHEEVLRFLRGFAEDSGVVELVRFGHEVVWVERRVVEGRNDEWVVEWRRRDGEAGAEVFEAVVVCNGKYTEPRLAEFPEVLGEENKYIAITIEFPNHTKIRTESSPSRRWKMGPCVMARSLKRRASRRMHFEDAEIGLWTSGFRQNIEEDVARLIRHRTLRKDGDDCW